MLCSVLCPWASAGKRGGGGAGAAGAGARTARTGMPSHVFPDVRAYGSGCVGGSRNTEMYGRTNVPPFASPFCTMADTAMQSSNVDSPRMLSDIAPAPRPLTLTASNPTPDDRPLPLPRRREQASLAIAVYRANTIVKPATAPAPAPSYLVSSQQFSATESGNPPPPAGAAQSDPTQQQTRTLSVRSTQYAVRSARCQRVAPLLAPQPAI